MNKIGKLISESRKSKGLTQENLAEMAGLNLRTIQRIENNENEPRRTTVQLVCKALEIIESDITHLLPDKESKQSTSSQIANFIFLGILNLILMAIFGYFTLDSHATENSRIAAILLSFLIPFFIVWKTQQMSRIERFIKFGSGFLIYLILVLISPGFPRGFVTLLIPCIAICLVTLHYGKDILERIK